MLEILLGVSTVIGIVVGQQSSIDFRPFILVAIIPLLLCLCAKSPVVKIGVALCVMLIIFTLRSQSTSIRISDKESIDLHSDTTVVGVVTGNPQYSNTSKSLVISNIETESGKKISSDIIAIVPSYERVVYGDRVRIHGKTVEDSDQDGYQTYLRAHNIIGTMVWPKIKVEEHHQANIILDYSYQWQQILSDKAIRLFPKDDAAMVMGIVFGIPMPISSGFNNALKASSISHILVASGFNVSIVIASMMKIQGYIGKRKALALSIIPIICYICLSGAATSIMRAAIMAWMATIAMLLGRQHEALRVAILSAILMLLINPEWLFDIGFQLSFAATLGIILFQSSLSKILKQLPLWIQETCSTTAAAQILVLPIIAWNFHTISLVSLLTNVLILWMVPWIMLGGFVVIILSLIAPAVALAGAYIIEPGVILVHKIIMITASMPMASMSVTIPLSVIYAYYGVIVSIVLWRRRWRPWISGA